jgi:hypothetical protein
MAFIRSKMVNGNKYYQVVRNYREGGKHKQEVICHIGIHPSLREEVAYRQIQVKRHRNAAALWEQEAKAAEDYLLEFYGIQFDSYGPDKAARLGVIKRAEQELEHWISLTEEQRGLYKRHLSDYGPIEGIIDYHISKRNAEQNNERADLHDAKIKELTQVHRKYFVQQGMTFS